MKNSCAALLALVFAFAIPSYLFAQSANEQNSLLPEIDPQDIEIRSEFKARFPGLRRQPILGFNPKPRVFQIDPNRLPFMETAAEVVANLPVSQLSRPVPPVQPTIYKANRSYGFIRTGLGSYTSPEATAFAATKLNEDNILSAAIDFRSSDGHLDAQGSAFRMLDADLEWIGKVKPDLLLTGKVGLNSDFNYLAEQIATVNSSPQKDFTVFNGGFEAKKFKNRLEYWEASFDYRLTAISVDPNNARNFAGSLLIPGEVNEQFVQASFKNNWAGNKLFETYSIFGDVNIGQYDFTGFQSTSIINAKAGADYQRILDTGTKVNATAAIQFIDDGIDGNIYIAPELRIRQNFQEKVLIEASAFGQPELLTITDHHQINRFLDYTTALKQTYSVGATGRATINISNYFSLFGGLNYSFINNYNFYTGAALTPALGSDPIGYLYTIGSADASILKFYSGISHEIVPETLWFSAEAYARAPKFSGGGDIPFEERLGLTGTLSLRPINAVLLETWVDYIGERENPFSADDLTGFLLVNVKAEAEIAKNFGAYIKSLNLLNSEYQIWQGYTERPFQLFVGITYKF